MTHKLAILEKIAENRDENWGIPYNRRMPSANHWIKKLQLKPHPEGGYFRETYRSKQTLRTKSGPRAVSTAIYFLITKGQPSRVHRIKSDEMWHFYAGDDLILTMHSSRGQKRTIVMGKIKTLQAVVPAGWWMSARVATGAYALVGCTVSPGFDFRDFELLSSYR